jgi:hypothetical protein
MPTRYTKKGELQQLQYEVGHEITRDAPHIAKGVFGDNARHPDMATVSNAELDQIYREAYGRNDREFLAQEAQRDPQQFLNVTDRIGVMDPPLDQHGKPTAEPGVNDQVAGALQQQAAQQAAIEQPVMPPPAPALPQPPPAPVLGPAPMSPQLPLPGMAPQITAT